MVNKVIIGILIFLVVLMGSLGTYSYTLSQQVSGLSEQLASYQVEQATLIGAVTDELAVFKGEALNTIDRLSEGINENIAEIDVLGEKIDETMTRISGVQDEIADVSSVLSQSVLNAAEIYQEASQSTVRITDGESVIGSGFIIDDEGHVVTAQHVVEGLTEIVAILADGSFSSATVAGGCQFSDIAVLTLEDEPAVKPVRFADSSAVSVGQPVVTIGNPFDLTETLTSGVVSQLNRFIEIEYDTRTRWVANLIQFDAAVNFGNSGCALLNSEGEVIGMVVARINPEQGDGIYHAVSSNKLNRVTTSLINQGSFDYPWLGIGVTDLTPQEARDRGLDTVNGVLVNSPIAGGPAETAGIKVDDIILAIDGKEIRNVAELISYLGEHKSPDEETTIILTRDNTILELSLSMGKQ